MSTIHISGGRIGRGTAVTAVVALLPRRRAVRSTGRTTACCRCNRSLTCSTVRTAVRNPVWCNQCRVGAQPRVAALISLTVIWHTSGASCHGSSMDGAVEVARANASCDHGCASGSIRPCLSMVVMGMWSRQPAATWSGDHPATAPSQVASS